MLPTPLYEDQTLLQDLASGDEQAYRRFYLLYKNDLYRLMLRYLKSHELAQDATQDIFIKIWEKREKFSGVDLLKPYLWRFARNYAVDILRAAGRSRVAMGEILRHFDPNPGCLEDATLEADYRDFIRRTLESLSPRSREIFILCREQEKTYEEVSKALGISRSAVRKHMVHSLRIFRDAAETELGVSLGVVLPLLPLVLHPLQK